MNEADAYKIAADVLHPFEKKIDVSTGQTLADHIVIVLLKAYEEGQGLASATDKKIQCKCVLWSHQNYPWAHDKNCPKYRPR